MGNNPTRASYTPSTFPTTIYDVQSGKVVAPDGVVYSVEASTHAGADGWKVMLAPTG